MNQECILTIVNDLLLCIGKENQRQSLLLMILQRFAHYTACDAGLVFLEQHLTATGFVAQLIACTGDPAFECLINQHQPIPSAFVQQDIAVLDQSHYQSLLPKQSGHDSNALPLCDFFTHHKPRFYFATLSSAA